MRIALYQPDIPQNTGTILRFCACLGVACDIIRPAGFDISHRSLRRAGMDYLPNVELQIHDSWDRFRAAILSNSRNRLIALTTRGELTYTSFRFRPDDTLLLGRESAGLPDEIMAGCDARLAIPMRSGMRSLNIAVAAAIVTGEASAFSVTATPLRQ